MLLLGRNTARKLNIFCASGRSRQRRHAGAGKMRGRSAKLRCLSGCGHTSANSQIHCARHGTHGVPGTDGTIGASAKVTGATSLIGLAVMWQNADFRAIAISGEDAPLPHDRFQAATRVHL